MSTIHLGILFDVSGSMKSPIDSLHEKEIQKKDKLIDILEKLCNKENIEIFSLIFGVRKKNVLFFDFISLLDITNCIFPELTVIDEKLAPQRDGFGGKIEDLLSKHHTRDLFIEKYLYIADNKPTERLLEFLYNFAKDDQPLVDEIYNSFPEECRVESNHNSLQNTQHRLANTTETAQKIAINGGYATGSSFLCTGLVAGIDNFLPAATSLIGFSPGVAITICIGIGVLSLASYLTSKGTERVGNHINNLETNAENRVIKESYIRIIKKVINKVVNSEINRRISNKNIKTKKGKEIIEILKSQKKKITSPDKQDVKIMDLFENHIYGKTPLYTTIKKSFNEFKKGEKNFLLLVTDGELTDEPENLDYIKEITDESIKKDITIIGIYLTDKEIKKENYLYDYPPYYFEEGASDLLNMCTMLDYENPIIKFFIQKNWDIPLSGQCRLFVEINNSQNLDHFIQLINQSLDEIDRNDSLSLTNLIATTSIQDYVNSNVINQFKVNKQKGGTCYANALTASACFASARVLGRKPLDFKQILEQTIKKYGYKGANTSKIIEPFLKQFRLRCKKINEKEARKAVIRTRPCLAIFYLSGPQWCNFSNFFRNNKKGILTKSILNQSIQTEETAGGHAVVLTHIGPNYFKFLNSWGKNWGDGGYFKVENLNVFDKFAIFDVFWRIDDLTQSEKDFYDTYMKEKKKELNLYLNNSE